MSIICRATSEIPGNASWRIPYGLFFIIPTLLAVGVWWIPEVCHRTFTLKMAY
jgi:MFS transporter, SP family, sugar:H+ symporter